MHQTGFLIHLTSIQIVIYKHHQRLVRLMKQRSPISVSISSESFAGSGPLG